jgi:hypothetical protein
MPAFFDSYLKVVLAQLFEPAPAGLDDNFFGDLEALR